MRRSLLFALAFALGLLVFRSPLAAEEKNLVNELEKAKRRATAEEYELRYKFTQGEVIKTKVVHLASTDTTIQGNTQTSKSRSISTKVWKIIDTSPEGNVTFEHSVEKAEMWQHISGRAEVSYNSETDSTPPLEYERAAETIGVPLAIITVNPQGEVIKREDLKPTFNNLGLGQITMPLPNGKVKIGAQWHFPTEVLVSLPDGKVKRVKTRQQYTLESVETGIATISVKTQVLTPVNDPKLEAQLVQQLTNGEVRFDIEAGRVRSKQMDWDELVIGFSGADSTLKYLARFTEENLPASERVAEKP